LVSDLKSVTRLTASARQQLYRVLGPCLADPVPDVEAQLNQFCRDFDVSGKDVARAVKACRVLLRQAAAIGLSGEEFARDLDSLGDTGVLKDALLSGYDLAVKVVRDEILRGTFADHGKLVERVSWRVDKIAASDRGEKIGLPVVVMTLAYHEGGRRKRITVQMGPDQLRELRAMCDRLL
jgi:hypothetical protein